MAFFQWRLFFSKERARAVMISKEAKKLNIPDYCDRQMTEKEIRDLIDDRYTHLHYRYQMLSELMSMKQETLKNVRWQPNPSYFNQKHGYHRVSEFHYIGWPDPFPKHKIIDYKLSKYVKSVKLYNMTLASTTNLYVSPNVNITNLFK
jgi:hypothetical protein